VSCSVHTAVLRGKPDVSEPLQFSQSVARSTIVAVVVVVVVVVVVAVSQSLQLLAVRRRRFCRRRRRRRRPRRCRCRCSLPPFIVCFGDFVRATG